MTIQRLQSHWGFTRMPFGRGLAPSMLHRHGGHAEAVARIAWCIDQHALGVITGEVGAGKTVAVRAATAALDRYLSDTTFSAAQLRFVQLIVEHLTANGVMEVARLYESPFTDHPPQGPDMIFSDEQIDGLVEILGEVWQRAIPDVAVA